ncbi:CRISPR-associated DxTHG motif protein [Campylobacter rectus]|nr:CRISPR-associated DxTHG motif protein [Campylobacter rectus]
MTHGFNFICLFDSI